MPGWVVKWWGFKINTSSFDEVQNEWICTSTLPQGKVKDIAIC
jgi:hypothetical protein